MEKMTWSKSKFHKVYYLANLEIHFFVYSETVAKQIRLW